MNYLSHYYIDRKDERPYFMVGCILPDLYRSFHKDIRVRHKHIAAKRSSTDLPARSYTQAGVINHINEGILRHLEIDRLFHTSSFFKQNTKNITAILKQHSFEHIDKYFFFLSHILLELMLDRILIKQYPKLTEQFYLTLDKIEEKYFEMHLKSINFVEYAEGFTSFFNQFRSVQYLKGYIDNEKLILALNKIWGRIGQQPFSEQDKKELNAVINEIENIFTHPLNPPLYLWGIHPPQIERGKPKAGGELKF